jgi:GNAT superfamily N-acetyltransferase
MPPVAGPRAVAALFTLRPLLAEDEEFSFKVYASTRADEMNLVDWSDQQKQAFLRMQFKAQGQHYRNHYPTAQYYVIQRDGVDAGRLFRDLSGKELLLMDIVLLPQYRNAGIGTEIIKELIKEAGQLGLPLVLHVEFFNPVISLYTRLGFVKTREVNAVYHEMVWTPVFIATEKTVHDA